MLSLVFPRHLSNFIRDPATWHYKFPNYTVKLLRREPVPRKVFGPEEKLINVNVMNYSVSEVWNNMKGDGKCNFKEDFKKFSYKSKLNT